MRSLKWWKFAEVKPWLKAQVSAGSDLQLLSSFLRLCCAPLSLGAFTTFPFHVLLRMLRLSRAEVDPYGQELIPWCCSGGASPAHPDFPVH